MRPARRILLALSVCFAILGCQEQRASSPDTVDIIAEDYEFTAPDTVPAGWVTLKLHNQGSETHYMEIDRLPDEVSFAEYRPRVERLAALVDSLGTVLADGALDTAEAVRRLRAAAPDTFWGGSLTDPGEDAGGVGLLGPGETARTTLRLEPGIYSMICLMPTTGEETHLERGMIEPLVVTGPASGASPPAPDVVMRYDGGRLSTEPPVRRGRQVAALHVGDLGSDEAGGKVGVYLARLDDGIRSEEVVRWVTDGSYRPPAPTTFLGGVDEIGDGDSAYVTLDLAAGEYGWVIFPFGAETKPFVEEFDVE